MINAYSLSKYTNIRYIEHAVTKCRMSIFIFKAVVYKLIKIKEKKEIESRDIQRNDGLFE